MDDFLIAFGVLWLVICAYAGVAFRISGMALDEAVPGESLPGIGKEQRRLPYATRSPGRMRSSRR